MKRGKHFAVAVLGIGEMGATHVRAAMDSPFVSRVIGYEPEAERARSRGEELGIAFTSDLDGIWSDPEIRFVSIASPNETHCQLAVAALRSGKAVLCEKPMGTTIIEAGEMLRAEKETGGFLQIGFELRYSQLYRKTKDWIDAGLIGRPLNSHCDYYCSEFHLRDSWRSRSEKGLIGEKLCHYLDLPRWWFGAEVTDIYSISAPNFVPYFNHPDNHQILFRFEGGGVSSLMFTMGTAETFDGDPLRSNVISEQADDGHQLTYLLYGTRGAIQTDAFRRRLRRWEFTDAPDKLHSKLVETITYPPEEDSLWMHNVYGQIGQVIQLVAEGQPPQIAAEDSLNTMRLVFSAELSEKEHRVVPLQEMRSTQKIS